MLPNSSAGTVTVAVSGMNVTITATPATDYFIDASHIIAEKMVEPSVSHHASGLSSSLPISGSNPFTFTIPDGYTGAYVTVNFYKKTEGFIQITSLSEITDMDGKYQLTTDVSGLSSSLGEFKGTLDGGLHKIIGSSAPLFASIDGAIIRNIIFEDVNISSGDTDGDAGAVTSKAKGATRIYNCGILPTSVERDDKGNITGFYGSSVGATRNVGGLVGTLSGTARVINCFSYANITGGTNKGGIVGSNEETSTQASLTTMVMNCLFYGEIANGENDSPIYGGTEINNVEGGLNNYNYYRYNSSYSKSKQINKYNRALAMEEKFITRFERYRLLLNSNKKLAAKYASTATVTVEPDDMAKWVLETADRSISGRDPYPYPVLKTQGYYPSIINPDIEHAPDSASVGRNHGGKLAKTLSVTIATSKSTGGQTWPTGANITTGSLTLQRTDKDFDRFNFNYDKVQLPYYNDIGTGNYTGRRVVTGWKITSITGGTAGTFSEADEWGGYNFANRKCTDKDLYSVSKRVFSQGAYWDVPEGVTAITIEPYWAIANYVSDATYDVVYDNAYTAKSFSPFGTQYANNSDIDIYGDGNKQKVYTTIGNAIGNFDSDNKTVYDQAVVLVGNVHQYANPTNTNKPYTVMSIDMNHDNEPDYSYIFSHDNRRPIDPIRYDFLNIMGIAEAQIPNGATLLRNVSIFNLKGWFEITNTCLVNFSQFEIENSKDSQNHATKSPAPLILLGGTYEQIASTQKTPRPASTQYIHIGSNAWFAKFGNGTHSDGQGFTPHIPVSVTGGDYDEFYLSGTYQPDAAVESDNAECYISGGRFGEMAGASMEAIQGDVQWDINWADITNFYGGGVNAVNPITGKIQVDITNSYVNQYCGGPKFGDMEEDKTVTTNATGCVFGTFFGAGYGGNAYKRLKYKDVQNTEPAAHQGDYKNERGKYYDGATSSTSYGKKGKGVATDFDYEFFVWSTGGTGSRFYVNFVTFSLATTRGVTSNLLNCKVTGNVYGGGSLGKVDGNVSTTLKDCKVSGNVFGAGYSATLPKVGVRKTPAFIAGKAPTKNMNIGMFESGEINTTEEYEWKQVATSDLSNGGTGMVTQDGKNYVYTDTNLSALGTVTGNATLNIEGTTTVGGSVYGGGEESGVDGNTEVTVTGGTIGTTGKGGAEYGNVYGGGKGKADDVTAGIVKGSTTVSISGSPTILHNVYGGGAYGSVGTFSYDATTGFPTGWNTTDDKGKCTVSITGGTIGTTGDNNGMVFGSSRGLEGDPSIPNVDKMAWVYDTEVTIGTQNAQSNATPAIKGSVYGGGENGHNFHDAKVTVHSGTIGIPEGSAIVNDGGTPDDTSDDISYSGARFPNRGNVYGSGCGTDTYTGTDSKTYFDFNAGIVRGNTTVLIDGGHVVHNVYGGGAMGSVGTYTFADAAYHTAHPEVPVGKPISCADGTGTCTVTVSRGQIGVTGATMAEHGKGGPDDYGHVFGAGRGEMHDPDQYPNMETCAFFNKTILNISGTAFLTGSAYGGSESGHVLGDTEVNISGGQIGCGKDSSGPFDNAVWADDYIPTGESMDCASWPFESPFAPYDPFANATGDLDQYPNGESTDGGRLEASDGHTYYGNVFGGGSGSIPYFDETKGTSEYLMTAGTVEGNTSVTISGGHVLTNVYGGCETTNVLGSATITMTGGTVGVPRTVAQIIAHPNTGYIFGAGKGDQRIFFNKETNVDRTFVNIEGGRVYGSIFGGGEDGHVFQNAIVNIGKAGEAGPIIGTSGTSYVDGNVFGGGRGFGGEALTAGNIGGSIVLNIKSGKILGSVYGGGRLGSVGYGLYLVDEEITEDEQTIKPYGILRPNDKYDGSYPNPSTQDASAYYDKGRGYITINISGGTIGNDYEYIYNPTDEQKAAIPNTTFDYQNHLQYTKGGNVFTGGMGRLYALDNTTLLPLWPKLGKCKSTTLNMTGGTVKSSIYGGGEIGAVAENATVNVNGGTVGTKVVDPDDNTKYYYFGSVFGGGKGSVDNITYPSTTPEADKIPISEAGTTGGDVEVHLNKTVASDDSKKGAIVSQVFGCNDMNGSPKGDVTVHVYATQNADKDNISTKYDKGGTETYDVEAVYGGGNQAAYEPEGGKTTTKSTKVIIDGCGLTSIKQVYGGGNAASTPATNVTVNGTYEIMELFGGGNGFDKLPDGKPNPGANVGYKNYTIYEKVGDDWVAKDDPAYDTKEERTAGGSGITYGTGQASINVYGGTVHRVFGGSNTKGNVHQTAVTLLDENSGCEFCVDEAYGGGKSAPMDAEAKLLMACIPGLQAAYGGAEAAAIKGNVTLNITNGTFDRVFGGNNLSGTIDGSITVNIEEVGCRPIKIGELYGGGNQAGYSVYGYNADGTPKETGTKLYDDPQVNVKSFTSIGKVFGGGYGEGATMVGNPTVNVNEVYGKWYNDNTSVVGEDAKTSGNYPIPSHAKGKMGAISEVFGGGNAAKVMGNTTVNIATLPEVYIVKQVTAGEALPEGCYTRSGAGTTADPFVYTTATGTASADVTYYEKKDVLGVDIRGNVYGGGNNAEVTGDAKVKIGKKNE